ncbi:MAG: esterase [Limnohabitans sp.]
MHDNSLMLARPEASDQLVLLFHGVGSSAQDLAPVGQALAQARPRATVVSVEAPHPSQLGRGKEWFSVVGVSEENRPQRIAQAMPLFLQTIQHWQGVTGIGPDRTVLVGFSQGAIMSLESTQTSTQPIQAAHTVISLAGRFAGAVCRAPADVRLHLIHGEQDGVVQTRWSVEAASQWRALGGTVTLDLVPGLGHGIDARALRHVVEYLS